MKPEIKTKWVKALRSDEFTKTTGRLAYSSGHCCLGVLAELAIRDGVVVPKGWEDRSTLPVSVMEWAGLNTNDPKVMGAYLHPVRLSYLNDAAQWTFKRIADTIEQQL